MGYHEYNSLCFEDAGSVTPEYEDKIVQLL